jgi:hypothetical protein
VDGRDGATAIAPTAELVSCPSDTLRQYVPPSSVRQTPPAQAPKYATAGESG